MQEADINEAAITSMFPKNIGSVLMPDEEDEIEIFKYTEKLPVALNMNMKISVTRTWQ